MTAGKYQLGKNSEQDPKLVPDNKYSGDVNINTGELSIMLADDSLFKTLFTQLHRSPGLFSPHAKYNVC